jgi:hypothetical protein
MSFLTFKEAVARQEGFGPPLNRSTRNNNPGDIEYGPFAIAHGATRIEVTPLHEVPRFAYFPSSTIGFSAMSALLKLHYIGLTITQVIEKYAPPVENNDNAYIEDICKWTGLTPTTVLTAALLS